MMPIEMEAMIMLNNGWSSADKKELIYDYHFVPEYAHELCEAMRKIEQDPESMRKVERIRKLRKT